ncbi:AAA family ATPase [Streptomyces sp. DW26H14]|uniref:AAA family ATPase n=1 Tax=Streptomyces sp. DW26H14 TaxID=3435395 RepID=UPI00403DFC44
MSQHRPVLVGRDDEVRAVAETLRGAGPAHTLALTGAAGAGRTAALAEARRIVAGEGGRVHRLAWESAEGRPGVPALADAVCRVLAEVHDGRLPVRVTEIRRAALRTAGLDGDLTVLSAMGRMLADAAHYFPFALVVDDCERMPAPTASALGLLLRAFRPAGLPVVLACRSEGPGRADRGLCAAADRVLDLPPLAADDVRTLISQWLGRPCDSEVARAVMRSLGPLAGNPRALLSVVGALTEDGGLLDVDGRVRLLDGRCALRLGGTVREAWRVACPGPPVDADVLGGAVVLAHLTGAAEFRLSDVQDKVRRVPRFSSEAARTVDMLVSHHVLTIDPAGALSFAVPALAAALRRSPPSGDLHAAHAAIVASAVARLGATAGADHPRLAEHVMAAGGLVDGEVAAPLLLTAAGAYAGRAPDRAVRAYLEALRYLPAGHTSRAGVLRTAAVLAWRNADHVGLLALGGPLCATVAAGPGPVPADLESPAMTWGLAALYEHLGPNGENAEPWAVVRHVPGGPELAALGGRYGIGPIVPGPRRGLADAGGTPRQASHGATPGDRMAAAGSPLVGTCGGGHRAAPRAGLGLSAVAAPTTGPAGGGFTGETSDVLTRISVGAPAADLPSPAQLRLLAAAVGGGDALRAAHGDLPPGGPGDKALDAVRTAAGYGDLAGAFAEVLTKSCQTSRGTVAERYHAMVNAYVAGRWEEALSYARGIVARFRPPEAAGVGVLARVLAAEIHCATGEQQRALAWLGQVPDTVAHPLGGWVRLGVRYRAGNPEEAFDGGRRDVRRAREHGLLAGLERLLARLFQYGVYEERPEVSHRAMAELEALYEESAAPRAGEVMMLARSVLRQDPEGVRQVLDLAAEGDRPFKLLCLEMGALADDNPEPWLAAAIEEAYSLGFRHIERSPLGHRARMRGLNVTAPRRRAAGEEQGELDLRLVEMVTRGATNRQIAVQLTCSEKTVEQRLTRLFRQTGCRSRSELAAARLNGRLGRLGPRLNGSARR